MFAQTTKVKFVGSFSAILNFFAVGTCLCKAQEQKKVLGELKLEGKHIERPASKQANAGWLNEQNSST